MEHRKPLLIAHRGESFDAPENTHAAFDLAWRRGCQAIELDVHVTADGEVVVCHDRDTLRTAGVKHVIRETSMSVLQSLDVGVWKSPKFAGQRIATLASVLERVPSGRKVFVEIKPGAEAVGAVAEVLDEHLQVDATVIAFDAEAIPAVKRRRPGKPAMWLLSPKRGEDGGWSVDGPQMLRRTLELGADGIDLDAKFDVTTELVKEFHASGLEFWVWTVDDPIRARELIAMGVEGITTNRTAWMREQLGNEPRTQ